MTLKIYKYTMTAYHEEQVLYLKGGARIKKLGVQGDRICLWAIVNPEAVSLERRTFLVIATGENVPEHTTYLDTVFMGDRVWHVFEK